MKSEKDSTIVDTRKKKPRTLTERVEALERDVADLKRDVSDLKRKGKSSV